MEKIPSFDDINSEEIEKFIRDLAEVGPRVDGLVKKHSPEKFEPLPDAEERLEKVKQVCKRVAEQHRGKMETEFFPDELSVSITVEVMLISFTKNLLHAFYDIMEYLTAFMIVPNGNTIRIVLDVRYYKGDVSPLELAIRELGEE